MALTMGQYGRHPARTTKAEATISWCVVDIGASGAATVRTGSCPGWTCTKNATGVYDIVFPAFPAAGGAMFEGRIHKSATPTVAMCTTLAVDTAAGTAQVKTALATPGTGVEPASGDVLAFSVIGGVTGVY